MADLEAAQGCWNIISVEVEGREFPPGSARIVITGDRFVSIGMGSQHYKQRVVCKGRRVSDSGTLL